MNRKQKRRFALTNDEMEVSMTPMIDVVFQLLIYFLVTFSTADVLRIWIFRARRPRPPGRRLRLRQT